MTDQDWEVDGATAGSAGGGGNEAKWAKDRELESLATDLRPANVVPFPGNWFGSVDDLVPVHPAPRVATERRAAGAGEPSAAAAADATDFWEGEADALEEPSPAAEPQSSITLLRSGRVARRTDRSAGDPAAVNAGATSDGDALDDAARPRIERARWMRALAATAFASAAAGALLATHALSGVLGSGVTRHQAHTAAASRQQTARVITRTVTNPVTVTTTVATPERRHRPAKARVHKGSRPQRQGTPDKTVGSVTSPATAGSETPTVSAPSRSASVSAGDATSHASESVPASKHEPQGSEHHSSVASGVAGSGCAAISPDSGCRP